MLYDGDPDAVDCIFTLKIEARPRALRDEVFQW